MDDEDDETSQDESAAIDVDVTMAEEVCRRQDETDDALAMANMMIRMVRAATMDWQPVDTCIGYGWIMINYGDEVRV